MPCCIGLQVSEQAVESNSEGGAVQGPGVDLVAPSAAGAGHQQCSGAWLQQLPLQAQAWYCFCYVGKRLVTFHCSRSGMQLSEICSSGCLLMLYVCGELGTSAAASVPFAILWRLRHGRLHLGRMSDSHPCCRSPGSPTDYRAAMAASILRLRLMTLWNLRLGRAVMTNKGCLDS